MTSSSRNSKRRSEVMTDSLRGSMCVLVLVVSRMAVAPAVSAQEVATSFEQLRSVVKPGDTLHVTDASGRKIKGRLGELSASSFELVVRKTGPDGRETFVPRARVSEGDITQIVVERRDSLLNGTLIGVAAGAGPFLLAWPKLRGTEVEIAAPLGALIAGAVGAATGAAVDAFITERTTVYHRPSGKRSSGMEVSALLSKSGAGVQMSVRF
jgi:hypothetical protein